jgi:hypothetical protein
MPACAEGLAVCLFFEMSKKNNFDYLLFAGPGSVAEVGGDTLLSWFDETRELFLMDYVDPRACFTGRITAKVLGRDELKGALKAFQLFNGLSAYPDNYEANLKAALRRGQSPEEYTVRIQADYPEARAR